MNETENQMKSPNFLGEVIPFALLALIIVAPIRLFVFQPFVVQGASMHPTFETSDYLIIDELSYHFREPRRGEVVVFKYPKDESKFFIKRIVGLPGETLEIENGQVYTTNDSEIRTLIAEDYASKDSSGYLRTTLANNEYFVMGDNRGASSDSRSWGPVTEDLIIGRPYLRLLPLGGIGVLPGNHSREN